jgi:hypothetical protein
MTPKQRGDKLWFQFFEEKNFRVGWSNVQGVERGSTPFKVFFIVFMSSFKRIFSAQKLQ